MKIIHDNIRWLVAALLISALPAVAEVRDTLEFDISGSTSESITVDGETFKLYTLPDCDLLDQTGAPMLPVKYIRLSVPYNATDITVTGAGPYTQSMTGDRIYPAPVPIPTDGSVTEAPDMVLDSAIYMTDAYWPACTAELVGNGFYMGENHIVTVAVYPMVYNPVTSQMRSHSQVRLTVSYTLGDTPGNMLVRYDPQLRQEERRQAMALVANPGQIEAHAVPASAVQHMIQQNPDTSSWPVPGYEYMVITTRELAPAFKRLIALKQQKGYRAGVVCVEDIVNDPLVQSGDIGYRLNIENTHITDDAGKIRQYLKQNFHYGTKYVLLAGDSVPFRLGYHAQVSGIFTDVPTDWYYADKDTNWNLDEDELYGEVNLYGSGVRFDLNPDFYVGRISPSNNEQVKNYTDKLYRYELNPGNGATAYLQNALITEGFLINKSEQIFESYKSVYRNSTLMVQASLDMRYPLGKDIVDTLNNKHYSYLSLGGHGNPRGIFTCGRSSHSYDIFSGLMAIQEYKKNASSGSLDELRNKYHPGVMYSYACETVPFDFLPQYYQNYNKIINMGQSFTLGKDYGGVAFIGNTRIGKLSVSPEQEKSFVTEIAKGNYKIGKAIAHSNPYNGNIYCAMVRNLIGDPEFELWTDIPHTFHSVSIVRNPHSISIDGLSSDSIVTIAVTDGQTQRMVAANSTSVQINNVNPNSAVTIYRHNYLPFIPTLILQNERIERSQYVIANDVYAGNSVDLNRPSGDLTIAHGSRYEIDAKGTVTLASGFKVETGAYFSVTRSDY